MKTYFFFIVHLLMNIFAFGQINQNGLPLVQNYPNTIYGGSEQNWAVVQDQRGFIYVGNNDDGVLEYDGKTWRKITITNQSIIRSLAVDESNIIFVGAVGEFGYLSPNEQGDLRYISLTSKLDSSVRDFQDIYSILLFPGKVYFCAINAIFEYDYTTVKKGVALPRFSFLSFKADQRILTGHYLQGILQVEKDTLVLAKGGDAFSKMNVFSIFPYRDHFKVLTGSEGIFAFNPETGFVGSNIVDPGSRHWFLNNIFYKGQLLADDCMMFATLYKGVLGFSAEGKAKIHLGISSGLLDDQATNVFCNKENEIVSHPLWITLNSGISKAEINNPIRVFGNESGLKGLVNDITRYNGILYVATSAGVFALLNTPEGLPVFQQVNGIDNYTWTLLKFKTTDKGEILLAGTDYGIYAIELLNSYCIEDRIKNLDQAGRRYGVYKIKQSVEPDNFIFGGNYFGQISYHKGVWKMEKHIKFQDDIRMLSQSKSGETWFGTDFSGFYRLKSGDGRQLDHFDTNHGLSSIYNSFIFDYNNDLLFSTKSGIYFFDEENARFIADSGLGKVVDASAGSVFRLSSSKENDFWVSLTSENRKWVEHVYLDKNQTWVQDTLPFKRLPNNSIDAIYLDQEDIVWLGISKKIYSYNPSIKKDYYSPYNCYVRKVLLNDDQVIFNGSFPEPIDEGGIVHLRIDQPDTYVPNLDYSNNNITFHYASPFFESESSTEYSSTLEGYSVVWSKWSHETYKVYTNLGEGEYIFKVKARNIYSIESQIASYRFVVLPPWYRTIWAFMGYIVMAIAVVVVIVKLYTRKLRLEKIRLEQIVAERTAEVVAQKREIEIQRDEIALQKKGVEDSIHYASRIQTAILPSDSYINQYIKDYFILWRPRDIVSGDFYWMTAKEDKVVLVAADCTGHGVPGAFMSMLGVSFLNEIVIKNNVLEAHLILNDLRASVKRTLSQTGKEGEAKDGMDIALTVIDFKANKMQFAGAYNPCYIFRNGEFNEIKADRMPIGIYIKEKESFTLNEVDLLPGDVFYIFSDGYVSQFGQGNGEKFKSSRLKELLNQIHPLPMAEQREILDKRLDEWRCDYDQVDDVLVLGVRI